MSNLRRVLGREVVDGIGFGEKAPTLLLVPVMVNTTAATRVAARLTTSAAVAAAQKAKEVNERYGLTTKVKAAASSAYSKAAEIENKHKVSSKVGGALSAGLTSFTKAMGGKESGKESAKNLPSVPR